MTKFYDLYNNFEKDWIYISIVRYIIANNMKLKDIEGTMNQKFYERLIEKNTQLEKKISNFKVIC